VIALVVGWTHLSHNTRDLLSSTSNPTVLREPWRQVRRSENLNSACYKSFSVSQS